MRLNYEIEGIAYVSLEQAFRPHTWNISGVSVERRYRGLGIASALLKAVIKDAQAERVELWLVPVSTENQQENLIRLYERLGFQQVGPYWICRPVIDSLI